MKRRVLGVIAVTGALVASMIGTGVAQAQELTPMEPRLLQQMVLRAQMPTTLGAWNQNLYQLETGGVPEVCPKRDGSFFSLPKAKNVGFVGYGVGANTSAVVEVFQYANAAQARNALRVLRNISCPGSAQIMSESGLVASENGSDFSDATRTTVVSSNSYRDGDASVTDSAAITQRGLAIIITKVTRFTPGNPTQEASAGEADRLGRFITRWHTQVLKAYDNFGLEKTAR